MKYRAKLKNTAYQTLRKSEKYTKTDMIYLARGGFWVWGGQFVILLAGLGLAVAFANLVPKEVYGEYRFLIAALGIFTAFSLSAIGPALTRSVAKGNTGILKYAFFTSLKWSISLIILSLTASLYYLLQGNNVLALGMLAIAIFQPIRQASTTFLAFLAGKKDFRKHATYFSIQEIISVVVLVAVMYFYPANAALFIWVFLLVKTLVLLAFFARTFILFKENKKPKTQPDCSLVSYAKHLSIMNWIVRIGGNIDKILVFHFLGAIEVALYTFALLPVDRAKDAMQSLGIIILPKFSGHDIKTLKGAITQKAFVLFFALLVITIILILIIPPVFHFILPAYDASIFYAQIASFALLTLPSILYIQALTAHERKKELYIVRFSSNILKIILLLVLLPLYGLWGAIFAYLCFFIAQLATSATCFYFIQETSLPE